MRLMWLDDKSGFNITVNLQELPPYAVLSHTWADDADEVTYQDIRDGTGQEKAGWEKLTFCAQKTKEAGLQYFWVDTCCIDRRNEAELATAIRSMFRWYAESVVCFVYLQDVPASKRSHNGIELWKDKFRVCRWFKRGWTLQELLAPKSLQFHASGAFLGDRSSLCDIIHEITGIEQAALRGQSLDSFTHITRLQWIRGRSTKIPEDLAYCLIGICGVSMSPRHGEMGREARLRLENKITKRHGIAALAASSHEVILSRDSREVMLEKLRFDAIESRKQNIRKALSTTCAWLLSHPTYIMWLQPGQDHHGFFWIKGKPGAGKSVLMRFLDAHITNTKQVGDICISFYFNARGEALEKTFAGLYRSLLLQLLTAAPELQSVLDSVRIFSNDNRVEGLQTVFLNACLKLGQRRLYCFIDALDECQEDDVSRMIEFFQDLGQSCYDLSTTVFVCFASRHYPILQIPSALQLILEKTDSHAADLEKYIRHHLKVGTQEQSKQIRIDILSKANGVFLWVVLVVEILKREFHNGRMFALRKRLNEVPPDLIDLFKEVTTRDRENINELLLCLKWILYAKRPLDLQEFYFAMMAGLNEDVHWDPEQVTVDDMHSFLLSSSKGLAELTKGASAKTQFIHESVRDFLTRGKGLDRIELEVRQSPSQIHEALKQCCLRGMQDDNVCKHGTGVSRLNSKASRIKVTGRFPFLDYATTFVLYHSDQAATEVPQCEFLDQFNLDEWLEKANFLQKHDVNLHKKPLDLIYVCAEKDLANLITMLGDQGYSLTEDSMQRNGTPLFAAFANRSPNAARVILEQSGAINADWIIEEVIINDYIGRSAYDRQVTVHRLHWACKHGYKNLVLYLLSDIPDVTILNQAMHSALGEGHTEIVKLLLDKGANVNAERGLHGNALSAASDRGHTEIVQLLLDKGANVNAEGGPHSNALRAALEGDHTEIIELLLDKGANINAKEGLYGNALCAASDRGHTKIVKLLLDKGVNVNAKGGVYGNALYAASDRGYTEIVKLLLDKGVNVNTEEGWYYNALSAASGRGHTEIVKLLLDKGANVNAEGGRHSNALRAALEGGHTEIVKLLLDKGVNVNTEEGGYYNALCAASDRGYTEIIELLLDKGANINAKEGLYGNALCAALDRGHTEIVELLLDKGVNVNAEGGGYGNAL